MEIVLITGMSGSGKSVALHALEDAGFYCIDNLPPELLLPFVELESQRRAQRVAIAMDVRSAASLPLVPQQLDALRAQGRNIKLLFWIRRLPRWFAATLKPGANIRSPSQRMPMVRVMRSAH